MIKFTIVIPILKYSVNMVDYMYDLNAKMAGTKFVNSSVSTSSILVHTYPPMQLSAHVFQM